MQFRGGLNSTGTRAALDAVNLLDDLERRLLEVGDGAFALSPVLNQGGDADVHVAARGRTRDPRLAETLADALGATCTQTPDGRVAVRFDDEAIAAAGAALEGDAPACLEAGDLLTGLPYVVDYCDPNTTKALHAGHLRNTALGHAVAAALEAAGADVTRQSQLADSGRSMAEAVAGYLMFGADATPASTGRKSDHFVGDLYARYVRETEASTAVVAPGDVPVARDLDERDDLARDLLVRWEAGDPEAVTLWHTVRDWAVAGQDATLARLGVVFERPIYDSESLTEIAPLVEEALARGVVSEGPCGGLVFETGREEYPHLPLTRTDGLPTQNLRVVAIWARLMRELPDVTLVHFSGDEWRAHREHVYELLRGLYPGRDVYPTHYLLHGMVSTGSGVMSSSRGGAPLIDDLLDELVAAPRVRAAARAEDPACTAERLAAIALIGFCLDRPMAKPLVLDPDALLDPQANAGWRIAHAWSRVCDSALDGSPDPAPDDPAYRFAVMRAQFYRRLLADTVERFDVATLMRYVGHLSRWYSATEHHPRTGRAMRSTLRHGMTALGLIET
jgi:arginyl-tRNA synthetase